MAVVLEIIDLLVCPKIHGCGCVADDTAPQKSNNAVKTAAIGGRVAVCHLIYEAIYKGSIKPISKFNLQCNENEETKRIKAAFTLPCLNKAAQRVVTVIANEPPAQMPIL